jgi:hypothetical protein
MKRKSFITTEFSLRSIRNLIPFVCILPLVFASVAFANEGGGGEEHTSVLKAFCGRS